MSGVQVSGVSVLDGRMRAAWLLLAHVRPEVARRRALRLVRVDAERKRMDEKELVDVVRLFRLYWAATAGDAAGDDLMLSLDVDGHGWVSDGMELFIQFGSLAEAKEMLEEKLREVFSEES